MVKTNFVWGNKSGVGNFAANDHISQETCSSIAVLCNMMVHRRGQENSKGERAKPSSLGGCFSECLPGVIFCYLKLRASFNLSEIV